MQIGRQPSRQRFVAFDDLEQCLLLAEEILLGAADETDGCVTEEIGVAHFAQGTLERLDFRREGSLHGDERFSRTNDGRGDREAFEHLVRVGSHEGAILERSRFALGTVRDDVSIAEFRAAVGDRAPLRRRREAATASTAQTCPFELVQDPCGSASAGGGECASAACSEVVVQRPHRPRRQQEVVFDAHVRGRT